MAKKIVETEKQKKQRIEARDQEATNYGTAGSPRAKKPKMDAARQKYKERMDDNAYETRRGAKTKKGPGFAKGGKVTVKKSPKKKK